MSATISSVIEPFIKRKIFSSEEQAVHVLLRDYTLREISKHKREAKRFERTYGMDFQQFSAYLHERSVLLTKGDLSPEQRRVLGRAVMQEEDDWLDWKVTLEMLESWLGLREETAL